MRGMTSRQLTRVTTLVALGQMMVGSVVSTTQLAVRETGVAALPQASVRVHVRLWERLQPVTVMALSVEVGLTLPQLSVAVAVPRAASIAAAVGLQFNVALPLALIT